MPPSPDRRRPCAGGSAGRGRRAGAAPRRQAVADLGPPRLDWTSPRPSPRAASMPSPSTAFPTAPSMAPQVKEAVYAPDWSDPERLTYTLRLAAILAELLPAGVTRLDQHGPGDVPRLGDSRPRRRPWQQTSPPRRGILADLKGAPRLPRRPGARAGAGLPLGRGGLADRRLRGGHPAPWGGLAAAPSRRLARAVERDPAPPPRRLPGHLPPGGPRRGSVGGAAGAAVRGIAVNKDPDQRRADLPDLA